MTTALHTVHVRINDAATGKPTPCRIRFSDAAGNYYAPFGRLAEFACGPNEDVGGNVCLRGTKYAYIDGACEIQLPATPMIVEAHKGPEYRPLREEVTLGPGKLALRFVVERWIDLRSEGWYSGDIRAYCLSPHAALLEAAAEDVAVVNLLVVDEFRIRTIDGTGGTNDRLPSAYAILPNAVAFSGQQPLVQVPGHLVAVNTHNRHPVLGALALLHCHRAVYPLSFGEPDGRDDWTLADWCDQCHRKKGLVVWANHLYPPETVVSTFGEPLADLVLGKIDALDVLYFWDEYYRLLNAGFRLPAVAGSVKLSNREALGEWRTYAQLAPENELSYTAWIEAIRAGRTFVTNGPLLRLDINGQGPGASLNLSEADESVHVRAECRSMGPPASLQLVANGVVVAEGAAMLETDVLLPEGGWLAARCWGHEQEVGEPPLAHTSPVYVRKGDQPPPVDPAAVQALLTELDRMLAWVRDEAHCDTDKQRADLRRIFEDARQALRSR